MSASGAVTRERLLRRPCPVCGSDEHNEAYTHHLVLPDQFPQARSVTVVVCSVCGMAFSNAAPSREAMDAYYASQLEFRTDLNALPTGAVTLSWHDARLEATATAISTRLPDHGARVLDIGCGSGALLAHLRARGFENLTGVDPSPSAVASGRAIGLDLRLGTVTDLPADLHGFDLVVLSHVIEHLSDPGTALDVAREVLLPGALLYVEVPDAKRLSQYVRLPFLEFNTEHVNYFSNMTLTGLAARHGFELVDVEGKSFTLQPGVVYPGISGFFRPAAGSRTAAADPLLETAIREYVLESKRCIAHIDHTLEPRLAPSSPVAVRGLGDLAWTLLAATMLARVDILAYLDGSPDKQRLTIQGRPIQDPAVELPADVPVILLSLQHERVMADEIARTQPGRLVIAVSELLPDAPGSGPDH
jgi:SAM-dependent methyltransferase